MERQGRRIVLALLALAAAAFGCDFQPDPERGPVRRAGAGGGERQGRVSPTQRLRQRDASRAASFGCDFQPDPPEGPSALPAPTVGERQDRVSTTQRLRQRDAVACENLVVFFGSWMHPGQEIYLTSDPGSHVWTGVAQGVPVNWPPVEEPHLVRVFDPHLVDTPTGGVTAARLLLGGQILTQYDSPGTPQESALVYVDGNGVGRNPL